MAFRLVSKEFPDAVVTFDPLSGRTMTLSDLCWFVLNDLLQAHSPRDTTALLQAVCETAGASADAAVTAQLDDSLASLLDAGLIHAEPQ
ncbi:hypothetical protein [Roseateles sp. P5_E8]